MEKKRNNFRAMVAHTAQTPLWVSIQVNELCNQHEKPIQYNQLTSSMLALPGTQEFVYIFKS